MAVPSSSSNSPLSKRFNSPGTSSKPSTPPEELPELSDVPCYTCRRRHVKCDKILPSCAKCAKKGVPCLGYQKPLRWAEGVAVRGKLKGKSQPVVDGKVVNIVRKTMQRQSSSALKEAAHIGLQATKGGSADVVADEDTLLELMAYHNQTMCAETVTFEESKFINRTIAPLTRETMKKLPRVVVNGILGNAAVHMASRQPGNATLERLALETKVKVFQSFNGLLQSSHNQQPDVIITASALVFAMDLFEYGTSRWMVHFLGTQQVMSSFGGIENLFTYYPHLQLNLTHMAYFETLWIILSQLPVTRAKVASRRCVEMLCHASRVKRSFYSPCPSPLLLSVWDIGACASKMLGSLTPITPVDSHKREKILLDLLSFRPEDGTNDVKEWYYQHIPISQERLQNWDLISSAWKGAITILALRYLYLGRPHLAPQGGARRSPTPSLMIQQDAWLVAQGGLNPEYQNPEDINFSDFLEEITDQESLPDYLSAGLAINDPLSRSPSPMPSPMPSPLPTIDHPEPSLWPNRYQIHNDAFTALSSSFFSLHDNLSPTCLRYILMPLLILALTSRRDSPERSLCCSYFSRYKDFMGTNYPPDPPQTNTGSREKQSSSPCGGEELNIDIPWEKLDEFSELAEQRQASSMGSAEGELTMSAPEWNWWDMLNHLKIDMTWPICSGTSHMERGHEFWAFKLISSVINEDTLSTWTNMSAGPGKASSSY